MNTLEQHWQSLWNRIEQAAIHSSRELTSINLLAVSKMISEEKIKMLYKLGQRHFAENYLQEALTKQANLREECPDIVWHFIGNIQKRKASLIAEHFEWVHGVDRIEVIDVLHKGREKIKRPLNICFQVNISKELSKHGFSDITELSHTLEQVYANFPLLAARGVMGMAAANINKETQQAQFRELRKIKEQLHQENKKWNVLSMGMSDDFEAAIEEGSTHLRIGSLLFGKREEK